MIRWRIENYSMCLILKRKRQPLLIHIEQHDIEIVFINMATPVRFARPIRQKFGDRVKIILLSHGNHSGDFLHLITKPIRNPP